jgi:hypothetical protein
VAGSGASGGGIARLGTAADRAGVTVAPRARVNGEGRASGAIGGGGARMSPAAADVKTAAAAAGGEPAEAEARGTVTAQRPARARQAVTIKRDRRERHEFVTGSTAEARTRTWWRRRRQLDCAQAVDQNHATLFARQLTTETRLSGLFVVREM